MPVKLKVSVSGIGETSDATVGMAHRAIKATEKITDGLASSVADSSANAIRSNPHPSNMWRRKGGGRMQLVDWQVAKGTSRSRFIVSALRVGPKGDKYAKSASMLEYIYGKEPKTPQGRALVRNLNKTWHRFNPMHIQGRNAWEVYENAVPRYLDRLASEVNDIMSEQGEL